MSDGLGHSGGRKQPYPSAVIEQEMEERELDRQIENLETAIALEFAKVGRIFGEIARLTARRDQLQSITYMINSETIRTATGHLAALDGQRGPACLAWNWAEEEMSRRDRLAQPNGRPRTASTAGA